jgi:hypothetical protein
VLTAILPDKPAPSDPTVHIITDTVHTAAEIQQFVSKHNGTRNLYYSVNPTKSDASKKAAKTNIAAIAYLLADCDPNDGESPEDAKDRYLERLSNDFEPEPTWIVDSGNGIQCGWRLEQLIDLSCYPLADKDGKFILGPEAQKIVDDVETRTKDIMVRLGAKPGTQNIDRILRLPRQQWVLWRGLQRIESAIYV